MNIVTVDNKDYLETFIAKIDNKHIDCTPFFVEVQECVDSLLKTYNRKRNTYYTYLDKEQYGGNLQAILNRFSGNYFSASFLKSYEVNPAGCFYSMLCEDEPSTAASIGSTFHKIMELWYKSHDRSIENLWSIYEKEVVLGQEEKVKEYIDGYLETPDYLTNKEFNHRDLICRCEVNGKEDIYIPDFGITLPTCAFVIDRIDFRDKKTYIIDYKTGSVTKNNLTFDGNLGQMIIYKWAIEQKFNREIKDVYICAPGNKKYLKCDCSLENQKILIDNIQEFFNKFREDNSRRIYEYTDLGYFTNRQMFEFKEIMNDSSLKMCKIPVKVYIGEHKDAF